MTERHAEYTAKLFDIYNDGIGKRIVVYATDGTRVTIWLGEYQHSKAAAELAPMELPVA